MPKSPTREHEERLILRRLTGRSSLLHKTELLFQHFRTRQADKFEQQRVNSLEFENDTLARWFKILGKYLYANSPKDLDRTFDRHPYLSRFIPVIQDTELTVTYNFDDYMEHALRKNRRKGDDTRGFETVTTPWMQFRRLDSVVYHPNGVIPSEPMEQPRGRFVFSESSFAKQMVGAQTWNNSFLVNHFCKNTCLIIGSSLEDETLRSVLIQSADATPGNCHYYVHYIPDGKNLAPARAEAISRANFNVFNLVTLFLDDSGIAALAELIQTDDANLAYLAKQAKTELTYRYYLTESE